MASATRFLPMLAATATIAAEEIVRDFALAGAGLHAGGANRACTADSLADEPGTWLLHWATTWTAGMLTTFTVRAS